MLDAIALQVPEVADALAGQQVKVRVTARTTRERVSTLRSMFRTNRQSKAPRRWVMSERLLPAFSIGWDFYSGLRMVTFTPSLWGRRKRTGMERPLPLMTDAIP